MTTLMTAAALIAVPIGAGALLGAGLRGWRGRRVGGLVAVIVCLALPVAVAVALVTRFPIVGLWDAAIEGLFFGAGILWGAHRGLADARNVLVGASSLVVGLLVLEILSRLFLPPPPGFPSRDGPHLFLADALRGDLTHQPWDTLAKDLVCSIAYGDSYPPILDLGQAPRDVVTPRAFVPRAGATRRVLHLGDSMAFGFGLGRDETFTADLERLEPGVQHVNAAIPGTAPDAYLAVLQSWVASHPIDLVVMHVYEGNDLDGLDSRYPCCEWQSLLAYDAEGGAALRCAKASTPDLSRAGWQWLRHHEPPPYLLRALVGMSSAAAHLAGLMAREPYFLADQPASTRLQHLESILRSARAALAARDIPFVAVVLPTRTWLETLATWQHYAPDIVAAARRAGVPALDGSEFFREAVVRGEKLFFEHPQDIHFGAPGHAVLAKWLHERLASGLTTVP